MLRPRHSPCARTFVAALLSVGSLVALTPLQPNRPSAIVMVTGPFVATILVQTHRIAFRGTGPQITVTKFGEVYAWSPMFFAVRENQPTRIPF
jgi:hypothetical protein